MKNLNIPYEITLVYFDHGTDLFPEVVNKKDLTKPSRKKVYNSVKSANFNLNGNKTVEEKDISEVVVLNSGFHISLAENSLFSSYERYNVKYGEGGPRVAVRIQNDESDREIHLCIPINKRNNILEKLSEKNNNIKDFIQGYFSENLENVDNIRDGITRGVLDIKKTAMKGTEIEQLLVGVDDTYNPRDVIVDVIESLSHVDSIDFSALSSKPLVDLNVTDGYYLSILEIDLKFFLGNYPKLKKFYIEKLLEKDNVEYKRILQYKSLYSDTSLDSILNLTQHYKGVFILKNLSNYFGLTEDDIKQLVIDKVMKN